jgi:hypothetical protein
MTSPNNNKAPSSPGYPTAGAPPLASGDSHHMTPEQHGAQASTTRKGMPAHTGAPAANMASHKAPAASAVRSTGTGKAATPASPRGK